MNHHKMTHTHQLIEKVEFLLQLIAGTEAGESETVKDICDLISKIKPELEIRKKWMDELKKMMPEPGELPKIIEHPVRELKNPKNPE